MGCMGLMYVYTLKVMPAYFLEEIRSIDTCESVKKASGEQSLPQLLTNNRHFEVDINP